jgi:hypothetical protein
VTALQPVPGNAKHQAALAAQAEQVIQLRAEIVESLAVLAELAGKLEYLAGARQRVRARLVTAEAREIFEAQARRDRAAARGLVGRSTDPTLAWMNAPARVGTGQVAAPVETLPALSVVAEIRYTLRHHIRRLGRPAKLNALEVEQTLEEDRGYCPWPRHRILTTRVDVDDQGVDHLAVRLAQLVDVYTNRKDLTALKRELDKLEESAKDITEGMPGKSAMLIGSETCPHCGRDTLSLLSRVPGITALVIRCEGTHQCRCNDDRCACRRPRDPARHEWINSGHATHTWHDLKRAQNKLKELLMLETKALEAIDHIRHIHRPVVMLTDDSDIEVPARFPMTGDAVPAHHKCNDDCGPDDDFNGEPGEMVHAVDICGTCGQLPLQTGQEPHESELWPCPTALACDLTGELAAQLAATTTEPEGTEQS